MFLIIGNLIIIHKLAQIGSEIIVILFSNQLRTEMERIFDEKFPLNCVTALLNSSVFLMVDTMSDFNSSTITSQLFRVGFSPISVTEGGQKVSSFRNISTLSSPSSNKCNSFANPVEMLVRPFF